MIFCRQLPLPSCARGRGSWSQTVRRRCLGRQGRTGGGAPGRRGSAAQRLSRACVGQSGRLISSAGVSQAEMMPGRARTLRSTQVLWFSAHSCDCYPVVNNAVNRYATAFVAPVFGRQSNPMITGSAGIGSVRCTGHCRCIYKARATSSTRERDGRCHSPIGALGSQVAEPSMEIGPIAFLNGARPCDVLSCSP